MLFIVEIVPVPAPSERSPEVLPVRHGFEVPRVDAQLKPAPMIDFEPLGDRPYHVLIREPMRVHLRIGRGGARLEGAVPRVAAC